MSIIWTMCFKSSTYTTYVFISKVNVRSQTWLNNGKFNGGYVTQNSLGTEVVQRQSNGEDF